MKEIQMQISINVDPAKIFMAVDSSELVPILKDKSDKFNMLEAFSKQELIQYMIDNNLIDEETVSFMVDAGKLKLEWILGKVANLQFQKSFSKAVEQVEPKKIDLDIALKSYYIINRRFI